MMGKGNRIQILASRKNQTMVILSKKSKQSKNYIFAANTRGAVTIDTQMS